MKSILSQLLKYVKNWGSDYEDEATFTQRVLNEYYKQLDKESGLK